MDRIARAGSWTRRGPVQWLLPIALVVMFPLTLFVLAMATGVPAVWLFVRPQRQVERLRSSMASGLMVRVLWLAVAALGAVAIVGDVAALTASS